MNMKKLVSVLLTLAMLCGMCPVMSFTATSAEDAVAQATTPTLTDSYEASTWYTIGTQTAKNAYRWGGYLVKYTPDFDAAVHLSSYYTNNNYGVRDRYKGKGYTCTNQYGIDIAINRYGYVVDIAEQGNIKIPEDGFVLSAVNRDAGSEKGDFYDTIGTTAKQNVKIGDFIHITGNATDGYTYYGCRVTDDSKFTHSSMALALPYPLICGTYTTRQQWTDFSSLSTTEKKKIGEATYPKVVQIGGNGVRTGTNEWNNDVLCKITGTNSDSGYPIGYVVSVGGNNIEVPEGYFAFKLPGQTISDNAAPAYNVSMLFKQTLVPGAVVNCGSYEIFARYDAAAAQRAARLMSGTLDANVTSRYNYSAYTILNDAKTKYELVNTARMQELYDNMALIADAVQNMGSYAEMEPYMATLYQNYDELCELEFEERPVEMRAVWIRPLPNDGVQRTVAELDALLEDEIVKHKNLGYNQIFVEAFYNSCTIFPVPETAGHKGLYYSQNPYLVPTNMTCGSSGLKGRNSNLTEPYDMLQRFIEICRENDVEPHIWWEVFYVGYKRTNDMTDSLFEYSVAQQILDTYEANDTTYNNWLNESQNGSYYYGAETDSAHQYFLSPASDNVRTFLLNTFEHVLKTYDAESFQLDYIRYPHTNSEKCFGYDDGTLWKFKQSSYYDESVHTDTYLKTYDGFYDADWVQFRADQVTTFIKQLRDKIAEVNPSYYLTSSPGADPDDSKKNLMQDVEYWLTNDLIDILYPMAYGENVPGMVAPGLVANNSKHFVCIGTSAGYDDDAFEARWLKEVRDAGADGIAAFGTIDSWKNYAWKNPAITPTGDPMKAADVYIEQVLIERAERMLAFGDISTTVYNSIVAAATTARQAVTTYGIADLRTFDAFRALQTIANTLDTNPKAALTKDVEYLQKIRNNAHLCIIPDVENAPMPMLSGDMTALAWSVVMDGIERIEFKNLTLDAGATYALYAENADASVMIELTGDNKFYFTNDRFANANVADITYYGTGALYYGDELQFQMGDVTADDKLNTDDLRELMKANVKYIELDEDQKAVSDANGDGKINTIDTRLFLEASLGLI